MKRVKFFSLLILIMVVQQAWAASVNKTERHVIAVQDLAKIGIRATNGSIIVSVWPKDSVEIVAHKRVDGSDEKARQMLRNIKIFIKPQDGVLLVYADVPNERRHGFWSWLFGMGIKNFSVNWEVKVPAKLAVEAQSTNGDIEVDDVNAPIAASTTNGNIDALRIGNKAELHSTNGKIYVYYTHLPQMGTIDISTTNGEIELILPTKAHCKISAYSTNGTISCDLRGATKRKSSRRECDVLLNKGGVEINLQTTNGDITVLNK